MGNRQITGSLHVATKNYDIYFIFHITISCRTCYDMVMCNSGRVRIDILYEEGKIACLKHNQNFITSSVFMIDNFRHSGNLSI